MDDIIVNILLASLVLLVVYYTFKKCFKESENHLWHEDVYIVANRAVIVVPLLKDSSRMLIKKATKLLHDQFQTEILHRYCRNISLLGFECKWEKANGSRKCISSLMLSTFNGLIVMFKLDMFDAMPHLKKILEDDSIVKIGVCVQLHALYLFNDFDVRVTSTFDLLYMAREAEHCDPMIFKTLMRHYIQMTEQINPHYPFDDEYEQSLTENARASIQGFKIYSSKLQPKGRPYVVRDIIDTYCRPYLNYFYCPLNTDTKIFFKRLESVKTLRNDVYKLLKRNQCTYCKESDRYHTYYPYLFESLDATVLVLCEPCHRRSRHSFWLAQVDLFIRPNDVPFGENCTTLNLKNVPIMTLAEMTDMCLKECYSNDNRQSRVELPIEIVVDPEHLTFIVIEDLEDCRYWLEDLKRHCDEIPALSLDCEWVPMPRRRPIALLQLTTCQGLCLLIRLCHIEIIPYELKEILEDKRITKVGVEVYRDAEYLRDDYGVTVTSTLDLRFMAEVADCEPGSLAKMAEKYIRFKLDKDDHRIHTAWESPKFTQHQIKYASNDVCAGMLLFKYFAYKIQQSMTMDFTTCLQVQYLCKPFFNQRYKSHIKNLSK